MLGPAEFYEIWSLDDNHFSFLFESIIQEQSLGASSGYANSELPYFI